ncbi:MAG: vWA domain-containing protein [Byssovorax sp.]
MNRFRLRFCALPLAVAALLPYGCGSSAGASGSTTASPTTTTSVTTGAGGMGGGTGSGGDLIDIDAGMGGGDDDAACAVSTVAATLIPANILFVIDRSGSMNCNPPPLQTSPQCELSPKPKFPAKPTKWDIVRDALKSAVAAMPSTARVGVSYFNNDDFCGVAQAPAVELGPIDMMHLAAIDASIDAVVPKGATPIIGGVTLGYAHMFYDDLAVGNDFVVLLTDGAETCAPELKETMIAQTVPDALSANIRTFVIGAPGSEPARAFLSQIAFAGGTAKDPACIHDAMPEDKGDCHFDMTDPNLDFATSLAAALDKISGQALSCELDVPKDVGSEVDYDKVNVTFTPNMGDDIPLFQDSSPCDTLSNGWQYNAAKTKILLCGDACKLVKSDPNGKISIALGCATQVAQ